MKTYRVKLSIGVVALVEADRYEADGGLLRFYRGSSVIAEYAQASVKEDVTEATKTQKIRLRAPRQFDDREPSP